MVGWSAPPWGGGPRALRPGGGSGFSGWGAGGAWMRGSLGHSRAAHRGLSDPLRAPSLGCLIGGLPSALPAFAQHSRSACWILGDRHTSCPIASHRAADAGPSGLPRKGKQAEASAFYPHAIPAKHGGSGAPTFGDPWLPDQPRAPT